MIYIVRHGLNFRVNIVYIHPKDSDTLTFYTTPKIWTSPFYIWTPRPLHLSSFELIANVSLKAKYCNSPFSLYLRMFIWEISDIGREFLFFLSFIIIIIIYLFF